MLSGNVVSRYVTAQRVALASFTTATQLVQQPESLASQLTGIKSKNACTVDRLWSASVAELAHIQSIHCTVKRDSEVLSGKRLRTRKATHPAACTSDCFTSSKNSLSLSESVQRQLGQQFLRSTEREKERAVKREQRHRAVRQRRSDTRLSSKLETKFELCRNLGTISGRTSRLVLQ